MTTPTPYRVLVTGPRDAADPYPLGDALTTRLRRLAPGQLLVVVHGACQDSRGRLVGTDGHADSWACWRRDGGYPVQVERHPAAEHGPWPACGPIRNGHMVRLGAAECLAVIAPCTRPRCGRPQPHGTHGTANCARLADRAGIPVTEIGALA